MKVTRSLGHWLGVRGSEPAEYDDSFVRLSWIHIVDGKVLLVRTPGTDVFFDPGGRRVEGLADEVALMRKIKKDLGIKLVRPQLIDSFQAPAYGKPMGTMVELRLYMAEHRQGVWFHWRRPRKEMILYPTKEKVELSPATLALVFKLQDEGYIHNAPIELQVALH